MSGMAVCSSMAWAMPVSRSSWSRSRWVDGASDEDREAVRQLFRVLWEYCAASTPHMQIIVTDHVELLDNWFKEAIVARWRAGLALVPQVWLE